MKRNILQKIVETMKWNRNSPCQLSTLSRDKVSHESHTTFLSAAFPRFLCSHQFLHKHMRASSQKAQDKRLFISLTKKIIDTEKIFTSLFLSSVLSTPKTSQGVVNKRKVCFKLNRWNVPGNIGLLGFPISPFFSFFSKSQWHLKNGIYSF